MQAAIDEIGVDDRDLTATRRMMGTVAAQIDSHRLRLTIEAKKRAEVQP